MTEARSQSPADEQAARWWLHLRASGVGAADAAELEAFDAWLRGEPAHAEAWAAMERTAAALDRLPAAETQTLRALARATTAVIAPATGAAVAPSPATAAARPSRRRATQAVLAGVGLAFVGTGAWWAIDAQWRAPTFERSFTTARGERLEVPLPDGSRLTLDAMTRLAVVLYRDRREVRLLRGQAMFDVAVSAAQPFRVMAASTRVSVLGTRFSVRHVGPGVEVQVEEGAVRVARVSGVAHGSAGRTIADDAADAVLLRAGGAVSADAEGRLAAPREVAPARVAAWRHGRLEFDATPLAQALAEFARYGDTGLRIVDARVAALRVTGSFEIARVQDFAQALPLVLPVRLRREAGLTEIVVR